MNGYTHHQFWAALEELAELRGLSMSGMARQAGLDPTSFNKSKRMSPRNLPKWPRTDSLFRVLVITETSLGEFEQILMSVKKPLDMSFYKA